jgi:chromosome segregation ATPase
LLSQKMTFNMRDGPPRSPRSGGSPSGENTSSVGSASTLLREITTLRGRLTELEDDTRSSVCDDSNDLSNMLRKELSKVEHEKAKIEREFMNQLSGLARENHNVVSKLEDKLSESENQNATLTRLLKSINEEKDQESVTADDEVKSLRFKVEEERNAREKEGGAHAKECEQIEEAHAKEIDQIKEAHAKEIEQMNTNLASADIEIADSRRELDHLHEEVDGLSSRRQDLLEEVTATKLNLSREMKISESFSAQLKESEKSEELLRLELAEKNAYVDAKNEELGEMNDSIIVMEEHKEMMKLEITDIRKQLLKEEELNSELKARNEELQTPVSSKCTSTQTEQKGAVSDEIRPPMSPSEREQLEDGVTKLEERLQRMQSKFSEKDQTIDILAGNLSEERKLSKKLKSELRRLKGKSTDSSDTPIEQRIANEKRKSSTVKECQSEIDFLRNTNKVLNDEIKSLRRQNGNTVGNTQRSSSPDSRSQSNRSQSPQPRVRPNPMTPPPAARKGTINGPASPRTPVSGMVARFERKNYDLPPQTSDGDDETAVTLPTALEIVDDLLERETVAGLQEKLSNEEALVAKLRADLETVSMQANSSTNIELKLEESEQEIERLRILVEDYEEQQSELEMEIQRSDIDRRLQDREIERLQSEANDTRDQAYMQEEKKSEEDGNDEELIRLRAQVAALQPELDRTLTEIEKLQCEVDRLRVALKSEQLASLQLVQQAQKQASDEDSLSVSVKDQKTYESEINFRMVEFTKIQMDKAQMEMEYMGSIKELETVIEALEVEADAELDEKQKELDELRSILSIKEGDIARLENEKAQICSSMKNASFSRKDDMEDLQVELLEATFKTTQQTREIQSLKAQIESFESRKGDLDKKLQGRLRELEDEVNSTRQASNGQVSRQEFDDLKADNNDLRDSVRNVSVERRRLQERLDALVTDKSSSKSVTVLRDRNTALKKEVEKLTKRLKKMEAGITRCAV